MMTYNLKLANVFLTLIGISSALAQIAFPEDVDADKSKKNIDGRKPLYSPARCKQHELLYPGDQADDWICDCAPAAIFHPETEACYPAYRRGPCRAGEMLVLYKNAIIPECRTNPCNRDNHFQINGKCYEFGNRDSNPCPMQEYTYVLGIDPKSLEVSCIQLSVQLSSRFGTDDAPVALNYNTHDAKKCARGSRLAVQGQCK